MDDVVSKRGRRRMLAVVAVAGLSPLGAFIGTSRARAELTHLSEDDPRAERLDYVHDATKANRTVMLGVPGSEQFCASCKWLGDGEGEWRPCPQFPGRLVNVSGWCLYWEPKA